ncbi:hypothetical protein BrevBR_06295 [Brevundimonas sp. BR2-1]|uniref:pPIWI-associating nuclease domain-containing protein n=1 Tax=Brevundimonas sp. BR2-1 TaxID=3031123 RepID=UPI003094BDB4
MSPSEYQRLVREAQRKQKAAIDAYNREVNRYNSQLRQNVAAVNREISRHNQAVRQDEQKRKTAISNYNREVRAHNSRVEANRRQIARELTRIHSHPTPDTYQAVRRSSIDLNAAYERVSSGAQTYSNDVEEFLVSEMPARENANSLALANALSDSEPVVAEDEGTATAITDELSKISPDLDARWKGALFSLNPQNPDAARHFCTSAREIITKILEAKAPDDVVEVDDPSCQRTPQGKPTRRSKIAFLLKRSGIINDALNDFVDEDMANVVQLFDVFNSATHGDAGKYSLARLGAIKQRVEGGIFFLTKIAA